jgi:DNA-directed RNA polymerase specialized sigma24 family protein
MHLNEGGSCKAQKKPSTYKACGKGQKRTQEVENSPPMWKFRRFWGKLAVLTRHLRPIRGQSDFADSSVMASPSPLDRCWMLNDSGCTLPIASAMRDAVEQHWPATERAAASILGDESLATEIMEQAIERAVAYLADHPPKDPEDVSAVLSRFCREEVGRRRKERAQFVFIDFSAVSQPSSSYPFSAADAAIDAETILREAPPGVRQAMMLRYGSSESWGEVASVTGTSVAAIRMSCRRFLDRIRQKLGIVGTPQ